jgi:hypothetical protein
MADSWNGSEEHKHSEERNTAHRKGRAEGLCQRLEGIACKWDRDCYHNQVHEQQYSRTDDRPLATPLGKPKATARKTGMVAWTPSPYTRRGDREKNQIWGRAASVTRPSTPGDLVRGIQLGTLCARGAWKINSHRDLEISSRRQS